jgi:predicted membrane channel-forming protein YqfA (hemolysin III family)
MFHFDKRTRADNEKVNLPFFALNLSPGFSDSTPIRAAPAPLVVPGSLDKGPPVQHEDDLECIGTEEDSYTITHAAEAMQRVLCFNPPVGNIARRKRVAAMRQKHSLLGVYGHTERLNAWTHVLGALVFLAFTILRPIFKLDTASVAGRLSAASSALAIVTFGTSTCYHVFGTVRRFSPWLRMSDHGAIYLGMAIACTADVAIATRNFENVPWQTVADTVFVATALLGFFLYRRSVLPPERTEIAWGECQLGLFRFQHSDFEWGALRSAGYVTLSFGFIQLLPVYYNNLEDSNASFVVLCNGIALALLVGGLLLDNVIIWPDVQYEDDYWKRKKPSLYCHSTACGCIVTSHAIWHLCTLLSIACLTIGREIVIYREF